MNTIKDLLRDLALDVRGENSRDIPVNISEDINELVDDYHDRFIKEISKYFGLEAK